MTAARVAAICLAAIGLLACSDERASEGSSTTVPPPEPALDLESVPGTIKAEVEAAYLDSWDRYAEAVDALDIAGLADRYAGAGLQTVLDEIARRRTENRPALVEVDHQVTITLEGFERASVFDQYLSQQVDIDPRTRLPVKPVEAVEIRELTTLELVDHVWKVTAITRLK